MKYVKWIAPILFIIAVVGCSLESQQQTISDLQSYVAQADTTIVALQAQVDELQDKKTAAQLKIDELQAQEAEWSELLSVLTGKELADAQAEIASINGVIDDYQSQVDSLDDTIDDLQDELRLGWTPLKDGLTDALAQAEVDLANAETRADQFWAWATAITGIINVPAVGGILGVVRKYKQKDGALQQLVGNIDRAFDKEEIKAKLGPLSNANLNREINKAKGKA
jgi:cell division protein FtsL